MNAARPNPLLLQPVLLQPALQPPDPWVRYWLAQLTLRLRREIAWCWRQRGAAPADAAETGLPAFSDPALDSLDLLRFAEDKAAFFAQDACAAHLSEALAALRPAAGLSRWAGMAQALGLDDAAQFVLACALAARSDASLGAVAAAAMNDARRPGISLALAQRLWDEPLAIVGCAEPSHALYRSGLLQRIGGSGSGDAHEDWMAPLSMPAAVACALLGEPSQRLLPAALRPLPAAHALPPEAAALALWLRNTPPQGLQIVPVRSSRGADTAAWVAGLGEALGSSILRLGEDIGPGHAALPALACAAWLQGADLLLPEHWAEALGEAHAGHLTEWWAPLSALALRCYLPVERPGLPRGLPAALLAPAFSVPTLGTQERAERWAAAARAGQKREATMPLPSADAADGAEAARRYRLPALASQRLEALLRSGQVQDRAALFALAQGEAALDMAQLAQPVALRFELSELVLPPAAGAQLQAIVSAMRQLGRVHHDWGCAHAWNEGGLAVMFCGPPGTGKTMAAEALAQELALPMYRIDLSQVVNKYIGETEKNLRRIFDAAETSDCLLFFDEADALFGKRTEVRDAHDRFANIEISYLLERMERFKGLAVLATNRRKDLDEAFGRRLRFIVEFPVPGTSERASLWRQVFPAPVDVSALDFAFLAQRFELAGGAIRSAAFNACLQAAATAPAAQPRVAMPEVLLAIKRELEKGGREVADEQFGHYAGLLPAQLQGSPA